MSEIVTKLRIFVASPSDVAEERKQLSKTINHLNIGIATTKKIVLELVRWETHAWPGFAQTAQEVINQQIGAYDIFVGIMWNRFGTPTLNAQSGTIEEFEIAYKLWVLHKRPKLMFYFNSQPFNPQSIEELDQKRKIIEFKQTLQKLGALYWEYNGLENFKDYIFNHLTQEIKNWEIADPIRQLDKNKLPKQEVFCEPSHWEHLDKKGDWQLNLQTKSFSGTGMFNYLFSQNEYGLRSFIIKLKIRFDSYEEYANEGSHTANAGIVFGRKSNLEGQTYCNILFTGTKILLEEIGSITGHDYRDFRHLDDGVEFNLKDKQLYSIDISITQQVVDVFIDNLRIYSVAAPRNVIGQVGLRPWRSRIECEYFEVREL